MPRTKPPMRLPRPIAVSMNAYVARYSSPGAFVISFASTMLDTVTMPTANWPAVPWSVFASRTASWRRKVQPSLRSATRRGASAAASSSWLGLRPPPRRPPASAPRAGALRTSGGTTIADSSAAETR